LDESSSFDGIAALPDEENVERRLSYAHNPNLDKDVVVATVNEVVVGFNWMRWWPQGDGSWLYHHRGHLLPGWRDQGIGTALLHRAESRLREAASWQKPGSAEFGATVTGGQEATRRLLLDHRYLPVSQVAEMRLSAGTPVPNRYLPGGFSLRRVTTEDLRPVWDLRTALFRERDRDQPGREADFRSFAAGADPSLWQIATQGDFTAGLVLAEMRGTVGVVTLVGVFRAFQSLGLSRSLLLHAVHDLREKGTSEIRLYAGDGAESTIRRERAETLGFREAGAVVQYRKPLN
jgi:ribosomal protein S18 acetylase RimI-like enzyme